MNVVIHEIRDAGDLKNERIVLKVVKDDDIGWHAVLESSEHPDGGVSTDIQRVYWFPDKTVKAKDLVVLYSKEGDDKEKANADGSTSHFFYWGARRPLWHRPDAAAVLVAFTELAFRVPAKEPRDLEPETEAPTSAHRRQRPAAGEKPSPRQS